MASLSMTTIVIPKDPHWFTGDFLSKSIIWEQRIRVRMRAPNKELFVDDTGCYSKLEGFLIASGQRNTRDKVKGKTRSGLFCLVE